MDSAQDLSPSTFFLSASVNVGAEQREYRGTMGVPGRPSNVILQKRFAISLLCMTADHVNHNIKKLTKMEESLGKLVYYIISKIL